MVCGAWNFPHLAKKKKKSLFLSNSGKPWGISLVVPPVSAHQMENAASGLSGASIRKWWGRKKETDIYVVTLLE